MTDYVDGDDVKEIFETDLTAAQLAPFCTSANLIVTDKLSGSLDSEQCIEIARWFAAHLAASTLDRMADNEKIGEASIKYSGVTGKGLDATMYGQQVKLLDTSGILANLGKKKVHFEMIN